MPVQVAGDAETLAADLAVVGALARVHDLVHLEAVGAVEALAALVAAKGPQPCVEPLMVPQQLLEGETLPADVAGVRALARVQQQVRVQAALEGEAPPTLRTQEGLVRGSVERLVGLELKELAEGLPAVFAAQLGLVLLPGAASPGAAGPGAGESPGPG